MTIEVPLSRGMVALIDDADEATVLSLGSWYAHRGAGGNFYARHNYWQGKKCKALMMHTLLTGWTLVDHANGDGLDNRRANLRPASVTQNAQNRRLRSDSRLGFKGVGRNGNRFRAAIWVAGRRLYLGTYATAADAARAYDAAAITHFGEFARLNFPNGDAA